jgi:hypothetical protein
LTALSTQTPCPILATSFCRKGGIPQPLEGGRMPGAPSGGPLGTASLFLAARVGPHDISLRGFARSSDPCPTVTKTPKDHAVSCHLARFKPF